VLPVAALVWAVVLVVQVQLVVHPVHRVHLVQLGVVNFQAARRWCLLATR
jgi:hypothetical protein